MQTIGGEHKRVAFVAPPFPAWFRLPNPSRPPTWFALRLTDSQLDTLHRLSWPLAPADRGPFLQAVAARLAEHPDLLGDGHIARVAIEVQRRFWSPPAVDGSGHRAGVGTYAR